MMVVLEGTVVGNLGSAVGLALMAALALGPAARAATLSINADRASYFPGELVTLTVIGNSEGASDHGLFGQILFDPAGLLDPNAITFTPQSGGPAGWLAGVHGCLDPGACILIDYIEDAPFWAPRWIPPSRRSRS